MRQIPHLNTSLHLLYCSPFTHFISVALCLSLCLHLSLSPYLYTHTRVHGKQLILLELFNNRGNWLLPIGWWTLRERPVEVMGGKSAPSNLPLCLINYKYVSLLGEIT